MLSQATADDTVAHSDQDKGSRAPGSAKDSQVQNAPRNVRAWASSQHQATCNGADGGDKAKQFLQHLHKHRQLLSWLRSHVCDNKMQTCDVLLNSTCRYAQLMVSCLCIVIGYQQFPQQCF